jgi:hypothetical protein
MQIRGQRATGALGGTAAMRLAHGDREGMKLVEEPRKVLRGIGGEGLAGEAGQGLICFAIAAGRGRQKLVTLTDAAQVLVGDGDGMAEGVEQDGVCGFGPTPGKASSRWRRTACGCGGESSSEPENSSSSMATNALSAGALRV